MHRTTELAALCVNSSMQQETGRSAPDSLPHPNKTGLVSFPKLRITLSIPAIHSLDETRLTTVEAQNRNSTSNGPIPFRSGSDDGTGGGQPAPAGRG